MKSCLMRSEQQHRSDNWIQASQVPKLNPDHLLSNSVHPAHPCSQSLALRCSRMKVCDDTTPSSTVKSIYLETFGCQMNELDSELVRGQLLAMGYTLTTEQDTADVILYNTCSVREQAENKAFSRVGIVGKEKAAGREVVLGVIGCLAERDGRDMIKRFPQVDLMCGPGELDKLPMLLDNALKTQFIASRADQESSSRIRSRNIDSVIALQGNNNRRTATLSAAKDDLELLDLSRAFDPDHASSNRRSAYVRITRGCNKFCTYCVVPNTRGAEVHRPPDNIIEECKSLADAGIIEVTLLGQTINHYVYVHGSAITVHGQESPQIGPGLKAFRSNGGPRSLGSCVTTFADLLHRIHEEVSAIQRLRFVTSYPRDFDDDALQVMADSPRICEYLHVPAQSGSNRILQQMNRGYTREEYVEFIHRARTFMPDVSVAGDIIVGFPTETDEDFELTCSLLREVRFKNNFIFKYSPRPGTVAINRFEDDVPEEIKRYRNNALLAIQAEISESVHAEQVGKTFDVMVEGKGQSTTASSNGIELRWQQKQVQMAGRTAGDLIVAFNVDNETIATTLPGTIVPVHITGSKSLLLLGEMAAQPIANSAESSVTA